MLLGYLTNIRQISEYTSDRQRALSSSQKSTYNNNNNTNKTNNNNDINGKYKNNNFVCISEHYVLLLSLYF